jgi:hypothetical protein
MKKNFLIKALKYEVNNSKSSLSIAVEGVTFSIVMFPIHWDKIAE